MNIDLNYEKIQAFADRFKQLKIGVIGDLMLDRYIWGHATRISPEAPVPVVKVAERTATLGGAANVLRNIIGLGATAVGFGVIGDDAAGKDIETISRQHGIRTDGFVVDPSRPTTVKTRLIADHQQVARIDEEIDLAIPEALATTLAARLKKLIASEKLDALIIQDYYKGMITRTLIDTVASICTENKIPMALDPHPGNFLKINGLTVMTPNRAEAFSMVNEYHTAPIEPITADARLHEVGKKIMANWQPDLLLITLGKHGMALYHGVDKPLHIPTVAMEVFDVSGAGDTVIASFITAYAAGASPAEAALISNHAAGIVVGKVGTAPVDIQELLASFNHEPQ